jgi:hypothetical protein
MSVNMSVTFSQNATDADMTRQLCGLLTCLHHVGTMSAKNLLRVLFFRLNQHTTIKYCNAAVLLLGDCDGAAAFWGGVLSDH